tara:strand:+ start:969 stop:1175 length:207 start_codon:yes stop_codon:yes gene_type:complete
MAKNYRVVREFNDMFFGVGKFYYRGRTRKFERMWTEHIDRAHDWYTRYQAKKVIERLGDPNARIEEVK